MACWGPEVSQGSTRLAWKKLALRYHLAWGDRKRKNETGERHLVNSLQRVLRRFLWAALWQASVFQAEGSGDKNGKEPWVFCGLSTLSWWSDSWAVIPGQVPCSHLGASYPLGHTQRMNCILAMTKGNSIDYFGESGLTLLIDHKHFFLI